MSRISAIASKRIQQEKKLLIPYLVAGDPDLTTTLALIQELVQQGADIINMSFGGSGRSVLEEEALAVAFSNAVLIAAAGNQGAYNDLNCGLRPRPSYPASHPYVLGVMAEAQPRRNRWGAAANGSNVDVGAAAA